MSIMCYQGSATSRPTDRTTRVCADSPPASDLGVEGAGPAQCAGRSVFRPDYAACFGHCAQQMMHITHYLQTTEGGKQK